MIIPEGVFVTGMVENLPLNIEGREPLPVSPVGDLRVFRDTPMLQTLQDATRASVRFARRHRRAIVIGGVVSATAYAYHSMKKAVRKAEEEREAMIQQAGEEARYRQCLARTRGECLAALENFLPALRKRLFLSVDVTGPVRELKALRGGGGGSRSRSGGSEAVADGSALAAEDLESREIELWEKVKVTALTRLVVALYTFNALALMLHIQLHILGRLSFEESLQILRRCKISPSSDNGPEVSNLSLSSGLPISQRAEATGEAGTATTSPGVVAPAANIAGGVALSIQARHALLSSTYEHVLGEGLRVLVKDVERAVARCTSSWYAHTRQEVGFQDLVAVLRRVRREIEGPIGGTRHYREAATGGGDGVNPSIGEGRDDFDGVSGAKHFQLLRYIINPADGINGVAMGQTIGIAERDATITGNSCPVSDGARPGAVGGNSTENAVRGVEGVGGVLDETWDTAESPNFASAFQNCLDATFGMVYEKIRQKAFCRGVGGRLQRPIVGDDGPRGADATGGSEGSGGGRAAAPATDQQAPMTAGVACGPEAVTAAARAGTGVMTGVVGGRMVGGAGPVGEGEERSQVLATVISQAKLVVNDILEPSASENGYVQAVAALPTVRELCFSVFCRNRASPALTQRQSQPWPQSSSSERL